MKNIVTIIVLLISISRYSQAQTVLTRSEESSQPQSRHSATSLIAHNLVDKQARVSYTAGESITLQPGFVAKAGSVFSASVRFYTPEQGGSSTDQLVIKAYPNPFRQETRVEYVLPYSSRVQGVLTNLQGQVLRQSTDAGLQERGVHYIDLSGNELPAGTYIYQIQTSTGQKTIRLTKESF